MENIDTNNKERKSSVNQTKKNNKTISTEYKENIDSLKNIISANIKLVENSPQEFDNSISNLSEELFNLLEECLYDNSNDTCKLFYTTFLNKLKPVEYEFLFKLLLSPNNNLNSKLKSKIVTSLIYLIKNKNFLISRIQRKEKKDSYNKPELFSVLLKICDKFIGFYKLNSKLQRKIARAVLKIAYKNNCQTNLVDYLKSQSTSNKDEYINTCVLISSLCYQPFFGIKNTKKNSYSLPKDIISKLKSSFLIPFYEDVIMIDEEVKESISLQNKFNSVLTVFESNEVSENEMEKTLAITNLQRLFSRNSSNYKFIEVFLSYKREYSIHSETLNQLFEKFSEYFFQNKNQAITGSAIRNFNLFTKNSLPNSTAKQMAEILLEKSFVADQVDINFSISCYLISLLSNQNLPSDVVFRSISFILEKFSLMYKETAKAKYDEMFNLLIKGLKARRLTNNIENSSSSDYCYDCFTSIYSDSTFSYFYPKVNEIFKILLVQNVVSKENLNNNSSVKLLNCINRLIEYSSSSKESLQIFSLGALLSGIIKGIDISSFVKSFSNTWNDTVKPIVENTSSSKTNLTEELWFAILEIYFYSKDNSDLFDLLENEIEEFNSTMLNLISSAVLDINNFNTDFYLRKIIFFYNKTSNEDKLALFKSILSNVFKKEEKAGEYTSINKQLLRKLLLVKKINESSHFSIIDILNQHKENNDKTEFLFVFLQMLSCNKKANKKDKILSECILKSRISNNTLTTFFSGISSLIFSDFGIFNSTNPLLFDAYIKLLQLMKVYCRDFTSTNLWKLAIKLLNNSKVGFIFENYNYYEKNLNYFSYFDLKTTLENLFERVNDMGVPLPIEILDETSFDKSISKNKVKELLTENYKKEIHKVLAYAISLYIKKLRVIKKLSELKILAFGNDTVLNDSVFKQLLLISKYSVLYDYCKQIILSLFNSDPTVIVLGNEFKKLMRIGTSNSLNRYFSTSTNNNNDHSTSNALRHEDLLNTAQQACESIRANPTDSNLNAFFKKYSSNIIDAVFLSLNSDSDNELKDYGVDLIVLLLNFDIDKLTVEKSCLNLISFLKENYFNYPLESLLATFYDVCKRKNLENYFYSVIEQLPHYNYMVKSLLIQLLIQKKAELKLSQTLINRVFLHLFDSSTNLVKDCCTFWNGAQLILSDAYTLSKEFNFEYQERILIEMCSSSITSYFNILTELNSEALDKLFQDYEKLVKEELLILSKNTNNDDEEDNEVENENTEEANNRERRRRIFEIKRVILILVKENVVLFEKKDKIKIIKFVVKNGVGESNSELFEILRSTIDKTVLSLNDTDSCKDILELTENTITSLISQDDSDSKHQQKSKFSALSLNLFLVGEIVKKLHSQKFKGEIKMTETVKKVILSTLITSISDIKKTSELNYFDVFAVEQVLIKAAECLSYCFTFSSKFEENTEKIIKETLTDIKDKGLKEVNIGYYYIISAYLRFKGINQFNKLGIFRTIENKCKSSCSDEEKISILCMLNVFSKTLNKLFEPIFVQHFDFICFMMNNREEIVRDAAKVIIKSQIKTLSGFGVKSIMPTLIKDLHSKNWRSKIVNVEILGNFAFCAPKQLSIFLPKVIKELLIVFNDAHPKVLEVSTLVLKDISSVITNPEIVELSDILISAFANPFENSKNALTALLETNFKHAIDPPSLGLIIPIIDYNLKILNETNKKLTAQLLGAISSLIKDPKMIHPYLDIIFPNLKAALFDSSPDVRNAMAKAIGGLTKSLGDLYKHEIIDWVSYYLEHEVDLVQRSGAAQAYAEILIAFGENNIAKTLPEIISKIRTDDKVKKEGYMSIFVFMPSCLGQRFEKYFDFIFPLIIDGFSDDNEKVRNVSNKIFEICISIFAKKNTKELVSPLLIRLFDSNWRIRNSSIALIKTLINSLGNEFYKEESDYFTKELREDILANTFILKADVSGNTGTIANMIWRDYVDNIPKFISRILNQIFNKVVFLFSSKNDDIIEIAEGLINLLVNKFSDKFFIELLPMIENAIEESKDDEVASYSKFVILQLACTDCSPKLMSGFKDKFVKIVKDNIFTPHLVVRKILASIIYDLTQKFPEQGIAKHFIQELMKIAREKCEIGSVNSNSNKVDLDAVENNDINNDSIDNILEIISNYVEVSKGEALQIVLPEIFKEPYYGKLLDLLHIISEDIADQLNDPVHLKEIYYNLIKSLPKVPEESIKALINISIQLKEDKIPIFIEVLQKNITTVQQPFEESKKIVYLMEVVSGYLTTVTHNLSLNINAIATLICSFLIFDEMCPENEKTNSPNLINKSDLTKINALINSSTKYLIEKIDKELVEQIIEVFYSKFIELVTQYNNEDNSINGNTRFERLNLKLSIILESLLLMIQNGLLHSQNKTTTCHIIALIINNMSRNNLKPFLIKLSGPIIRVLSEKGNVEIKEIILDALVDLTLKMQVDLKPIIPQFRSVLLKNLIEPSMNGGMERVIFKCSDCILHILYYDTRADLVCSELSKSINSKLVSEDVIRSLVEVEILTYIVKFHGKSIKASVIEDFLDHYIKVYADNSTVNPNFPFDIYLSLISVLMQIYNNNNNLSNDVSTNHKLKALEDLCKGNKMHLSTIRSLNAFNNDETKFNIKEIISILKQNHKENSVIPLKLMGKTINKTRYISNNNGVNNDLIDVILLYDELYMKIVNETGFFNVTDNILDANLLIYILSIGFSKVYDDDKDTLRTVLTYLIDLIDEGKINSQLLINTLSLLVTRKVLALNKQDNEFKESIISELKSIGMEKEQVTIVEAFLKKIYYLLK